MNNMIINKSMNNINIKKHEYEKKHMNNMRHEQHKLEQHEA
jgi:hypothetical protein